MMKKIFVLILACMMIIPVIAADLEKDGEAEITKDVAEPIISVKYEGTTTIATALSSKSLLSEKIAVLKTATVDAFKDEKYPLAISKDVAITNVIIDKYRCEAERCAYWITATRGGRSVAVNNPIWLIPGNAPYHTVVSDVYDSKTNTETITLKEDVKGAVVNILTMYADMQPIGAPTVGTKE